MQLRKNHIYKVELAGYIRDIFNYLIYFLYYFYLIIFTGSFLVTIPIISKTLYTFTNQDKKKHFFVLLQKQAGILQMIMYQ